MQKRIAYILGTIVHSDRILPLLSSLVIFSLLFFISCASQERVDEASGDEVEEVEDVESATKELQDENNLAELTEDSAIKEAESQLEELGDNADQDTSKEVVEDTTDIQATEESKDKVTEALEGTNEGVDVAKNDDSSSPNNQDAFEPPPTINESPTFESTADSSQTEARSLRVSSELPSIPSQAISKNGTLLNRFYFVRKGDNPTSVSGMIYGNEERSKDLVTWNGRRWKPGKVIYYSSPVDSNDQSMSNFYQERGVSPESYEITKGDWLSKIAEKKYQHSGSWKEVAILNGIDNPDRIEVGQRIQLYPTSLTDFSTGSMNAQNENVPPPVENPIVAEKPIQATPPTVDMPPPLPPPTQQNFVDSGSPTSPPIPVIDSNLSQNLPKKKKGDSKLDWAKLIEQNIIFIAIGAVIVLLLLSLSIINKRRKSHHDGDFDESMLKDKKLKR